MELLVAYDGDAAGYNMATSLSHEMVKTDNNFFFKGKSFDLLIIPTPTISADWLEGKYDYDGYVFLSKHAAKSGDLALTSHNTGNFSEAIFGGNPYEVSIPHPFIQKSYMKKLWEKRDLFPNFQITIEPTHHGPTALKKPVLFIEIGTTPKEWNDESLCSSVAKIVSDVLNSKIEKSPIAICFGGPHYSEKFTDELIQGEFSFGTVIPKHSLNSLSDDLFLHILKQNKNAQVALLDWKGLGKNKKNIINKLGTTDLEIIKI